MVSLIHASTQLFPLSLTTPYKTVLSRPDGFTIQNRADRYFVAGMLTAVLDWRPVAYLYGVSALAGSDYARRSARKKGYVRGAYYAFNLGLAAICLAHMGIIIIPMGSLANRSIFPLIPTPTGQRLTEVWKEHVDPFPRVELLRSVSKDDGRRGFGRQRLRRLPPSVVEVPAVVSRAPSTVQCGKRFRLDMRRSWKSERLGGRRRTSRDWTGSSGSPL